MAGWGRRFRIAIKGVNPRTRKPFIWHMFHARPGGGATRRRATAGRPRARGRRPAGIKFGSVEVAEARFPLTFERHEFRADSAGDGMHRGGVGAVLRLRIDIEEPARGQYRRRRRAPRAVRSARRQGRPASPLPAPVARAAAMRVLKTKEVGIPVRSGRRVPDRVVRGRWLRAAVEARRRGTGERSRERLHAALSEGSRLAPPTGRSTTSFRPPGRPRRAPRPEGGAQGSRAQARTEHVPVAASAWRREAARPSRRPRGLRPDAREPATRRRTGSCP